MIEDIGVDAVKIGMLHAPEVVRGGGRGDRPLHGCRNVVLDPVMVATSGDRADRARNRVRCWCANCSRAPPWSRPTSTRRRCCWAGPCTDGAELAPAAARPACAGRAGRAAQGRAPAGRRRRSTCCCRPDGAAGHARRRASPARTPTAPAARCRRRLPAHLALGCSLADAVQLARGLCHCGHRVMAPTCAPVAATGR